MQFKDIPSVIGESELPGEMLIYSMFLIMVEDMDKNPVLNQIIELIEKRQEEIMESEL